MATKPDIALGAYDDQIPQNAPKKHWDCSIAASSMVGIRMETILQRK